jgi:uracil-DNA glycosylase family 4
MNTSEYSALVNLVKDPFFGKRLVLFRNESEADFLRAWLCAEKSKDDAPLLMADLPELSSFVKNCSKCGAAFNKKTGIGSGENGLMVVLHSPLMIGREIQLYKKESSDMLKRIISAMNLSFGECYITNMIKCESADLLMKPSEMITNCLSLFEKELDLLKPKIVVVMGEIHPLQKIVNASRGVFWFDIAHPLSMVKNPELKRDAWGTLKKIIAKMKESEIV